MVDKDISESSCLGMARDSSLLSLYRQYEALWTISVCADGDNWWCDFNWGGDEVHNQCLIVIDGDVFLCSPSHESFKSVLKGEVLLTIIPTVDSSIYFQ